MIYREITVEGLFAKKTKPPFYLTFIPLPLPFLFLFPFPPSITLCISSLTSCCRQSLFVILPYRVFTHYQFHQAPGHFPTFSSYVPEVLYLETRYMMYMRNMMLQMYVFGVMYRMYKKSLVSEAMSVRIQGFVVDMPDFDLMVSRRDLA